MTPRLLIPEAVWALAEAVSFRLQELLLISILLVTGKSKMTAAAAAAAGGSRMRMEQTTLAAGNKGSKTRTTAGVHC